MVHARAAREVLGGSTRFVVEMRQGEEQDPYRDE